jgi:hypothetical protein
VIISSEKVMIKACALVLYKLFLFSVHKEQLTCNCMRCNLESEQYVVELQGQNQMFF